MKDSEGQVGSGPALERKGCSQVRFGTALGDRTDGPAASGTPVRDAFDGQVTQLALEWWSWALLNVKFAKKRQFGENHRFTRKKQWFPKVLGDPESSIVALRRLQWLRRSAVRRRFCRAWPLEAPLASRDAEAWGTLGAETGFPVFGVPRQPQDPCRTFCIDTYIWGIVPIICLLYTSPSPRDRG